MTAEDDGAVTIEKILEEKQAFDLSLRFEKASVEDVGRGWSVPAPGRAAVRAIGEPANVLQVAVADLCGPGDGVVRKRLVVSTADKKLRVLPAPGAVASTPAGLDAPPLVLDSPAIGLAIIGERHVAFTTTAGGIGVLDARTGDVVAQRRDHARYAVQVVAAPAGQAGVYYLATAGWDKKIFLYRLTVGSENAAFGLELLAELAVESLPESILFATKSDGHDDDGTYLVYGRQDSTFLYYCRIEASESSTGGRESTITTLRLVGRQNLAPYTTDWSTFSPSCVSASPVDPTLVGVATGSPPHMKLLIARLLFPRNLDRNGEGAAPPAGRQDGASDAADPREAAAVVLHANTPVELSNYAYPVVVWRPDGSGVWVNSEEGSIKGIDLAGKVVATLDGHEPGSKVRCLSSGVVDFDGKAVEVLVSGGFDRRLIVWVPGEVG